MLTVIPLSEKYARVLVSYNYTKYFENYSQTHAVQLLNIYQSKS